MLFANRHSTESRPGAVSRREFIGITAGIAAGCTAGLGDAITLGADVHTWGKSGVRDGHFKRPRAIAAWRDEVYVIDTTGRMQVFDYEGTHVRGWQLPKWDNGTPTGISPTDDGRVLVPDTHNSRLLEYDPSGELLNMWGEYGTGDEEFIYITDVVLDDEGRYFFSEYGVDADRVHVFSESRIFERTWGGNGEEPGKFARAMAIARASDGLLYVCDTANHRIQCFDHEGNLSHVIGAAGQAPGELKFPYDVDVAPDDTLVICEYGNNRISRFTTSGEFVGTFGRAGRDPGEFDAPRGACASADGFVFVADTNNDRIQRLPLETVA